MFFPQERHHKGHSMGHIPSNWKGTREGTFVGFWLLKGKLKTNLFLYRCIELEETLEMELKMGIAARMS